MAKIFRAPSTVKLPQRKQESQHDQYGGKSRKGFEVCRYCQNILFKKEWHHADSKKLKEIEDSKKEIHTSVCPACKMIKGNVWEGEIIIENTPVKHIDELLRLITAYGDRAEKKDPQDRIIETKKEKGRYIVKMTENQMAVKLAKKIKQTFKKVDLNISYSKEPYEVSRVVVTFI